MKVAVLGFGTVGKSVYDIITKSKDFEISFVLVRPDKCTDSFMVSDISYIANDSNTDIVVECMGGTDAAFKYACTCMNAGKHFVTSNKALVAEKGIELNNLALKNNVAFLFTAACGGATGILNRINLAKQTDRVFFCKGILNGTTNYILSGLKEGCFKSFDEGLKKAQQLGYAEQDPSADISGLDTLRKVILLSAVCFGLLPSDGLYCEGIENIDFIPDKELTIKLLGQCGLNKDGSLYAFVEPVITEKHSLYSNINSNLNYITYMAENSGEIGITGQGAGGLATASSVLGDLECIKHKVYAMLSPECKSTAVDNSKIKHKYLVNENNVTSYTDYISVKEMHEHAKHIRSNKGRIFFAAIEE